MRRSHFPIAIVAAALAGCSDLPTPTQFTSGPAGPPANAATLLGIVITSTTDLNGPLSLLESDGTEIGLTGDQLPTLSVVIGDQVEISGVFVDLHQLSAQRFVVLAVGGQPVSDGVLDELIGGFVLHLMKGGDRAVIDPPAELKQHVGDRVWITGSDSESPGDFGVIAILTKDLRANMNAARRR